MNNQRSELPASLHHLLRLPSLAFHVASVTLINLFVTAPVRVPEIVGWRYWVCQADTMGVGRLQ
eukprot:m.96591 g.96591  ORF g.96591 m.96591 type:complete len:64 (-) comp13075_c0_seq12:1425-1616(-)